MAFVHDHHSPPVFATDLVDPFGYEAEANEETDTVEQTGIHDGSPRDSAYPDIRSLMYECISQFTTQSNGGTTSQALVDALKQWGNALSKCGSTPKQLCWLLNDSYVEESKVETLNIDSLTGHDRLLAQALQNACSDTGFRMLIGYLSKEKDADEEKYYSQYDFEERDTSESQSESQDTMKAFSELHELRDTNGKKVLGYLKTSQDDVLQADLASSMGFGAPFALLLVPDDQFVSMLEAALDQDAYQSTYILPYLLEAWRSSSHGSTAIDTLHRICTTIITKKEQQLRGLSFNLNPRHYALEVAAVCAETKNKELFKSAIACVHVPVESRYFPLFRKILEHAPFEAVRDKVGASVHSCRTVEGRFAALNYLFEGGLREATLRETPGSATLLAWAINKMEQLLSTSQILVTKAFLPLMEFVVLQGGDTYFAKRVLPTLKESVAHTPFVIMFLNRLRTSELSQNTLEATFRDVVPLVREDFDLLPWNRDAFQRYADNEVTLDEKDEFGYRDIHISPIHGKQLVQFIDTCYSFGMVADAREVITKITNQVEHLHPNVFTPMMLPFLRDLPACVSQHGQSLLTNEFTSLFQVTITSYLEQCIDQEPVRPSNWTVKLAVCPSDRLVKLRLVDDRGGCRDCQILNRFLKSPEYRCFEWKIAMDKHNHLRDALYTGKVDCKTKSTRPDRWYRLSLEKTTTTYEEDFQSWDLRQKAASAELQKLDQQVLKDSFGAEYEDIKTMKNLRRAPSATNETRQIPSSSKGFEESPEFIAPQQTGHPAPASAPRKPLGSVRANMQLPGRSPATSRSDAGLKRKGNSGKVINPTRDGKRPRY